MTEPFDLDPPEYDIEGPRPPDPALTADARNRALRTFLTGLGIDVLVGVVLVLVTAFADVGSWGEVQWSILSLSIVKSIVQAGGAYVLRRFVDSSGIPTPLPPADPGEPDTP